MAIVEQHGPVDHHAVLWAVSQGAVVAMVVVAMFWLLPIGAATPSGGSGSTSGGSMAICDRN